MMAVAGFPMGDTVRVARAIATNQLARFAPGAYVRLTGQTGRGAAAEESPGDIAGYFRACTDAYFAKLGVAKSDTASFLANKTLMEYGPGDLPGVAALMVARGAEKVYCIDRFPLVNLSEKNARVLGQLVASCTGVERERLLSCLLDAANPGAGFDPRRIQYVVKPGGLSGLRETVDLVFSRAVLEHVNDLDATFADMSAALRPGAAAIHLVDLRSHGLHKANPLDFLAWSPGLWDLMYSEKGVPNRWRIDRYRKALKTLPIDLQALEPTQLATAEQVAEVRPMLADPFRTISDDDLRWLGFWLVFRKRGA
jgi:SAM-dependent methyltransferase